MRRFLPRLAAALLALTAARGTAQEDFRWWRSNSAGMALERFSSRTAALRNPYALSTGPLAPADLPPELLRYYSPFWRVELRTLYEDGGESRRQFLFIDGEGRTRFLSVLTAPEAPAGEPLPEAPPPRGPQGFIEFYDEGRLLTEARQLLSDGSEYITIYFYNRQVLTGAETRLQPPPQEPLPGGEAGEDEPPPGGLISTDRYRYNRSGSLRSVERVFPGDSSGRADPPRFRFPPLSPNSPVNTDFVSPAMAHSSEFMEDLILPGVNRVVYTTDDRGRILTETRQDEAGNTLGEIRNTWSADRLVSVEWESGEDRRLTEYDYDREGSRILERNFNKGVLERVVRREGGREVEELYMNGVPVLRAVWEGGRKISEERLRPARGAASPGKVFE